MPRRGPQKPNVAHAHPRAGAAGLARALAVWKSLERSRSTQVRIARELVETRSHELRRAHPGILSIGYGHRVEGKDRNQATKKREVCVTFLVKKKWDTPSATRARDAIPRHLYTYVEMSGARVLCAIPTDVQGLQHTGKIVQQGNRMVTAFANGLESISGMPCCVVRYPGGSRYLLGCHHVFAYSDVTTPVPDAVYICTEDNPAQVVGLLSGYFGQLGPDNSFFDAALASISNETLLAAVAVEPVPNGAVVQGESDLAGSVQIRTARGPIEADWLSIHKDLVLADYAQFPQVTLPVVVEVQTRDFVTIPGDSGSPVFDDTGTVLQGMHVAANGAGGSFFIPAYELLRATNYMGLSNDDADTLEIA